MNIHFFKPKYLIRFQTKRLIRWDGITPLVLGHPARYVIEKKKDRIWVRDFTLEKSMVHKVKTFDIAACLLEGKPIELSDLHPRDTLSIQTLKEMVSIVGKTVPISTTVIADKTIYALEDVLFRKHLQKVASAMLVLFVVVIGGKLLEPPLTTNEELIPAKYAKLILTKPKETKQEPSAGGSMAAQAQVKAIARAFQSQTVQKSMKSILRGGLSHYSVMATGRAIQSLSQKISGDQKQTGVGLQAKASDLLVATSAGNYQMGSDSGYGSGNGVNVKGQGKGQFEVGLNTADASVEEGLTKDEVAKVIHSHMNEIRYCYEAGIMKDPNIAGKMLVDFKINSNGIVPNAGVSEASLKDPQVTQCLLAKLKSWKFPQPRGGVNVAVSYPFIFKSLSR